MSYDTSLFIDIIESTQGIIFLRADHKNGIHIRLYQGLNGKLSIIDTTDNEMEDDTAKGHLIKLGLEDFIPRIFPVVKPEVKEINKPSIPIISETAGNAGDCTNCKGIGQLQEDEKLVACKECNGTGGLVNS